MRSAYIKFNNILAETDTFIRTMYFGLPPLQKNTRQLRRSEVLPIIAGTSPAIPDQDNAVWIGTPRTVYGTTLLTELAKKVGVSNIFIIITPTTSNVSQSEFNYKARWLMTNYPTLLPANYVYANGIHAFGGSNSVLITDLDEDSEAFSRGGGFSVVYPRAWNSFHYVYNDEDEAVSFALATLRNLMKV
jgi:hypothetical protein